MDDLKKFVDWLKTQGEVIKHLTTDKLVERFREEQKIREEHKDDPTDLGRGGA